MGKEKIAGSVKSSKCEYQVYCCPFYIKTGMPAMDASSPYSHGPERRVHIRLIHYALATL